MKKNLLYVSRQKAILLLYFIPFLLLFSSFFLTLFVLILLYRYLTGKCIFFADLQYLGVTFFPLLDVSEQKYFSGGGGEGHMHPLCTCLVKYFCFSSGKYQQWENLKKLFLGFIKDFKDCLSWIWGFSRKIKKLFP